MDGSSSYRQYLPDLSTPRFTAMRTQNAYEYVKTFLISAQPPWLHALYLHWRKLLKEPYRGVTTDGQIERGLYQLRDEDVPVGAISSAANDVLAAMSDEQRRTTCFHIDSPDWRSWSNPEFLFSDKGVRLDEITEGLRDLILQVLELSLSPEGFEKAVAAMRINHFLGELVQAPAVMNMYSYNFALFGEPSATQPWGYSFYGHHLCLNIFFYRSQIIISPWFTGAEPDVIDQGPFKGTRILQREESLGLELMQSLGPKKQEKAQIFKLMKDPAMPLGRWNHDDQRHLCGAYRDNRVVPYEGILVSEMDSKQQDMVLSIAEEYLLYLPKRSRELHLETIRSWFHKTYWSWIGGYRDDDVFYFRIQSPVIILEFDHHSGVFLTNKEPAKFHIHTLMRMPNQGDYGMALRPLIDFTEQKFLWEGERIVE